MTINFMIIDRSSFHVGYRKEGGFLIANKKMCQ